MGGQGDEETRRREGEKRIATSNKSKRQKKGPSMDCIRSINLQNPKSEHKQQNGVKGYRQRKVCTDRIAKTIAVNVDVDVDVVVCRCKKIASPKKGKPAPDLHPTSFVWLLSGAVNPKKSRLQIYPPYVRGTYVIQIYPTSTLPSPRTRYVVRYISVRPSVRQIYPYPIRRSVAVAVTVAVPVAVSCSSLGSISSFALR